MRLDTLPNLLAVTLAMAANHDLLDDGQLLYDHRVIVNAELCLKHTESELVRADAFCAKLREGDLQEFIEYGSVVLSCGVEDKNGKPVDPEEAWAVDNVLDTIEDAIQRVQL